MAAGVGVVASAWCKARSTAIRAPVSRQGETRGVQVLEVQQHHGEPSQQDQAANRAQDQQKSDQS